MGAIAAADPERAGAVLWPGDVARDDGLPGRLGPSAGDTVKPTGFRPWAFRGEMMLDQPRIELLVLLWLPLVAGVIVGVLGPNRLGLVRWIAAGVTAFHPDRCPSYRPDG